MHCILCESEKITKLFTGNDLLHSIKGEFELFECQNCKLVWLYPPLKDTELEKYYPEDYVSFPKAIDTEKNLLRKLDRQFGVSKRAKRVMQKGEKAGKILDVGCATGIFLNEMKKYGWDCYGIEPSAYAAHYAQEFFGIQVSNCLFEDNDYPDSFFNVITMWDVLEHVPSPQLALDEVNRLLKPNGLLVLSMPNTNAWEKIFFGKYWAGWDIPRHTYIFNDKNISDLLIHHNFRINEISSFTGRHGVLYLSTLFWLNSNQFPVYIKNSILFLVKSIVARILTYPYYMIADRINKSSIMTVFSRKLN